MYGKMKKMNHSYDSLKHLEMKSPTDSPEYVTMKYEEYQNEMLKKYKKK